MDNEKVAVPKSFGELLAKAFTSTTSPETTIPLNTFDKSKHVVVGEAPIYLQHLYCDSMQILIRMRDLNKANNNFSDEEGAEYNEKDLAELITLDHHYVLLFQIIGTCLHELYPNLKNKASASFIENWMVAYDKTKKPSDDFFIIEEIRFPTSVDISKLN